MELVYCKNYSNLTQIIFWSYSKWQFKVIHVRTEVCHQIFSGWEVQTLGNLLWNVWCIQRNMFLFKKIFAKRLNIGLSPWAWAEKTVHGVETLFGKEIAPITEVLQTSIWLQDDRTGFNFLYFKLNRSQ